MIKWLYSELAMVWGIVLISQLHIFAITGVTTALILIAVAAVQVVVKLFLYSKEGSGK